MVYHVAMNGVRVAVFSTRYEAERYVGDRFAHIISQPIHLWLAGNG